MALIERNADPAAYKVVCTHAILSPATQTMERLGLAPLLVARGAPRATARLAARLAIPRGTPPQPRPKAAQPDPVRPGGGGVTGRERALLALAVVGFVVPNARGLCFALPLFLLRERAVRQRGSAPAT